MQTELFEELPPTRSRLRRIQTPLFPSRFVRVRLAYEDLIFGFLGLLLTLLGGFCLGVERGKTLSAPRSLEMGSPSAPVMMTRQELSLPVTQPVVPRSVVSKSSPPEGAFAIQLASYVGAQAAQLEARRLHQKGWKAQVVEQGKFFELRVSGFASRSQALAQLVTLRKTYHDAFIKPVSSRKVFAKKQA